MAAAAAAAAAAANMAAAAVNVATLQAAIITCGVPQQNVVLFVQASALSTVKGLYLFTPKDGPKTLIESYHGLLPNTAQGRLRRVGAVVEASLGALIWLVHQKVKYGERFDPAEWTPALIPRVLNERRLAETAKDQTPKEPEYEVIKTGYGYEAWVTKFESDVASQLREQKHHQNHHVRRHRAPCYGRHRRTNDNSMYSLLSIYSISTVVIWFEIGLRGRVM